MGTITLIIALAAIATLAIAAIVFSNILKQEKRNSENLNLLMQKDFSEKLEGQKKEIESALKSHKRHVRQYVKGKTKKAVKDLKSGLLN